MADFLRASEFPALEIGCGCGVISLLALFRNKFPAVTGLEIQTDLAEIARLNAQQNGFSRRFFVRNADFREVYPEYAGQRVVFANPPFQPLKKGKLSRREEVRLAKFEVAITIRELLEKTASILHPGGALYLIYPYKRFQEVRALSFSLGLHVVQWRLVRPFPHSLPDRFLAELRKEERPGKESPPLTIFAEPGIYHKDMNMILSGEGDA